MNNKKARVIAFYLPQFHPIPENDDWWGKGFTEWTNVGKAKPLFKGHYQPRVPSDLGYYDLRIPEIREQQAELAKEAGIEGFCYWHYWFGKGKQLLEMPINEVLKNKKPDFPFCLGWANHTWSNKTWLSGSRFSSTTTLVEQTYPDVEGQKEYFFSLLEAFKDERYIKVDGKPLFPIFAPRDIPNVTEFIALWNSLAVKNGLKGIHFTAITSNSANYNIKEKRKFKLASINDAANIYKNLLDKGFDSVNSRGMWRAELIVKGRLIKLFHHALVKLIGGNVVNKYDYNKIIKNWFVEEDKWENVFPTLIPQYDRSPRAGKKAAVYYNSTPENFKKHIKQALEYVGGKSDEHKVLFLMSWNEWGECNYVEPDLKYGKKFLMAIKDTILKNKESE